MKKYYMGLAFFGLITELVVALGITGLQSVEDLKWSPFLGGFLLSLLTGIATTLFTAEYVSRQPYSASTVSKMLFNPLLIFVSGVLGGVLVNFVYQGLILDSAAGISNNFHTWFIKPFYWLMLIGAPASIVVGVIFFPLNIVMENLRKEK